VGPSGLRAILAAIEHRRHALSVLDISGNILAKARPSPPLRKGFRISDADVPLAAARKSIDWLYTTLASDEARNAAWNAWSRVVQSSSQLLHDATGVSRRNTNTALPLTYTKQAKRARKAIPSHSVLSEHYVRAPKEGNSAVKRRQPVSVSQPKAQRKALKARAKCANQRRDAFCGLDRESADAIKQLVHTLRRRHLVTSIGLAHTGLDHRAARYVLRIYKSELAAELKGNGPPTINSKVNASTAGALVVDLRLNALTRSEEVKIAHMLGTTSTS
jgi:hypothetical protein